MYEPVGGGGTRVGAPNVLIPDVGWIGDNVAVPWTGASGDTDDVPPNGDIGMLVVFRQPVMTETTAIDSSKGVGDSMKTEARF